MKYEYYFNIGLKLFKNITLALAVALVYVSTLARATVDIPVLSWSQRSDWLNVKNAPFNAVGNGVADDTAAIQAALTAAGAEYSYTRTVYLPPGTYKITAALNWQGTNTPWTLGADGAALIGCGRDTTIRWAGASGGTMFYSNGVTCTRYIGISWDGNNLAGAAYTHIPNSTHYYEGRIRHEHEAFRNFTVGGTYVSGRTLPAAAIITGVSGQTEPTAETLIWNCFFGNCTNGIIVGYEVGNCYQWFVNGCEFENCGTGISAPCGKMVICDNHFEGSTVRDFYTKEGLDHSVSRCTSHGSNSFFTVGWGGSPTPVSIQDCWVDSWTSTVSAVDLGSRGTTLVFDCMFTNPPNSAPPIRLSNPSDCLARLLVSNNYCSPTVTSLVAPGPLSTMLTIPPGSFGSTIGALSSATTTFLQTTWPADSTHIIDVTAAPYNVDKTGGIDATNALQSAITAAASANNGSIVYLPVGMYKVTSTLVVTGSNYTIQGSGRNTILNWCGADNSIVMSVTSPNNISLEQFHIYANPTVTAVKQTASTAGNMTYDGVYYTNYGGDNAVGAGFQLANLPAGSRVLLKHLDGPLTVSDCGLAEILVKWMIQGRIIVNGANYAKTGFLGVLNFQGGQSAANQSYWDIWVDDNQDLAIGHIYSESSYNHLKVSSGASTRTGRVTITGVKQNHITSGYTDILVNNYKGRVLYGPQLFANPTSTVITQTGTNPVDLILAGDSFFYYNMPTITVDTGCNLIEAQNIILTSGTYTYPTDVLPTGSLASIAAGYDHFRQLGAEDAKLNYGILNTVTNSFFETDTVNPTPLTALGTLPAGWSMDGKIATGSGVRTVSVVNNGSPFASGTQSMSVVDSTGSNVGSRIDLWQYPVLLPATKGAVFSFDVRLNSMASLNENIWIRVFAGGSAAQNMNIYSNGTSASYGPASLTLDKWYRIRAVLQPPSVGPANITLYVTPWTATGPGSTSTYTVAGTLAAPATSGFSRILINTPDPGKNVNVQFDNITLVTGDPLMP